ncbi:GH3 auxin-responsive promoter family protein [Nostoc sp. FACHB-152]|uniref:GH3 auxin-responsive promoter family protein n=1 Tax=unclassified Nostoc TaxID=2593658 RepID=UPI001688AA4C|nr:MULTISPECIES: GH3 auxin-responsive promoter family protein [unclassified Nostoc]MBD2451694.1 GH3 auxin-responsive promoter family protein [Nostoc sp. FACHB-152]MBD2472804.1 GH3 auxin-responsive promoter family protein [Nostoc sp. FACHB-145]
MTSLLFSLLTATARNSKANFVRKTRQVNAVQEQFLRNLLLAHKNTELGQKYGLKDIKTIDKFREQIPVLPYSSYEPYITRIAQGETNILTTDPVVYIVLTSGSTGKKKLVPVTKQTQKYLRLAHLTSLGFLSEALSARGLELGKILLTKSLQLLGTTSGGIKYGSASSGDLHMNKFFFKQVFAHPYETLEATDSLARHYLCLLFALREESMRGMAASFPMLILRNCSYLELYSEELIQDIDQGAIASWLKLEPELRAKLEPLCSPNPQRAAQLREILHSQGKLTPKYAWPNLSFVTTSRGGTSNFYFERFPHYFGNTPQFGAVYAASESVFSIYHNVNDDSSILTITSGFYEFIPEDQWEVEHPKTLLANEVKVGNRYRILTTNYSGFYRYDIGDVVEVLGFYEQTPLIVFRHRQGGLLSSITEKTTEFHVIQVMQALQRDFSLVLEDFCITLSENNFPAHYLVNIELAPGYTLNNPQTFLTRFDSKLKEIHTSYEIERRDLIPPPQLRILAPGSFAILRQRYLQKGMPECQLKLPHISEDRNLLVNLPVKYEVKFPENLHSFGQTIETLPHG